MTTPQLLQTVQFENIAPGGSQLLPHNINIHGIGQRPDLVMCDLAGITFNVTKTTIEAFNTTGENASPIAWLELKHSIERELGKGFGNPFASLSPRPFIPASSDQRGPFMEANVDAAAMNPKTYNVVSVSHAPGSGVYLLNLIIPVPTGVDVAVTTLGLNSTNPGFISYEWVDASNLRVRTWDFGDGIQPADIGFSVNVGLTIRNF